MAGFDVITIGAATIDAFVWAKEFREIRSSKFSTGVGECFSLGSKIDIDRFVQTTGGGATNCAATFSNFKLKTACVTRVGEDLFGEGIKLDLKRHGIATDFVVSSNKEQTAFSTILVVPSGERTVLVYRGPSERFNPKEVPWTNLNTRWFYVTNLAGNKAMLEKIVATAKHGGSKIFYNPGKADIRRGISRKLMSGISVLNLNREEAAELTGKASSDIKAMLRGLQKMTKGIVLITDGDHGAYFFDGTKMLFAKPRAIKAINRTGAGDAFGSGFLVGWMKKKDPTPALQLATHNAESVIQKIGAKAGLLTVMPSEKTLAHVRVRVVIP